MPRNLTLLQIDDDLFEQRRPSPYIDPVSVGSLSKGGIDDWLTSLEFWTWYDRDRPIDLITADIRFNADKTTPLLYDKRVGATSRVEKLDELLIPTGLSHLKPFAAVARAAGRPVGIAIHTADVRGWKARLASTNDAVRTMAYLAAHEIGEVAAILGQLTHLKDKSDDERLEICWKWLGDRTYATFEEAWRPTLQNYREALVRGAFKAGYPTIGDRERTNGLRPGRIIVLPTEWTRMAAWCERMRVEEEATLADRDPGFSFLLADGSHESIFFRSLFADAHLALRNPIDFEVESLPAKCFVIKQCEDAFKLDESGFPLIGAFLSEFKDLKEAYELAVRALDEFPVSRRASLRLGDVLSLTKCGSLCQLARLMAVLFQLIRRDSDLMYTWESAYQVQAWDVDAGGFLPDTFDGDAPSLARVLLSVFYCAKQFVDGFSREELKNLYNELMRNEGEHEVSQITIDCCLGILVSWCRLFFREEDGLYDVSDISPIPEGAVPPVPLMPPKGLLNAHDVRAEEFGPFLRDVFGYGSPRPNDNQIGRFVGEALGVTTKAGREFLTNFVNGSSPPWIKELCRMYAIDKLLWRPSDNWPRALR
jgi:hypothetical protein